MTINKQETLAAVILTVFSLMITSVALAAAPTNVTGSVNVVRGGFRMMQSTQRFVQSVTIRNNSSSAISAPLSLVLDSLSTNAKLYNPTGNTSCCAPNSAFVNVNVGSDGLLTPGEQVSVTLEFINPSKLGVTYVPRILSGIIPYPTEAKISNIKVLSPNGGEMWIANSKVVDSLSSIDSSEQFKRITWTPEPTFNDVYGNSEPAVMEVYLLDLNGNRIGRVPPFAFGSLDWVVGIISDTNCLQNNNDVSKYPNHCLHSLKLVNPGNYYIEVYNRVTGAKDVSDAPFTISSTLQ